MFYLIKKELNAFLNSLTGYIAIVFFLVATGFFLWISPGNSNLMDMGESSLTNFFILAPSIFMFLIPAITMRLFSEENRTGTLELLLTKPISEFKLVFSKFIAGLILVVIALLPTLIYYISIGLIGAESWNVDSASTWGGYIGLLLLGGVFVSIGLFTSSISKNQVVAFMLAMVLCFVFYLGFGYLASLFNSPIDLIFLNLGIAEHYSSIQRGVIDSRDIIYYLSLMIFFLYATRLVLQSRKW